MDDFDDYIMAYFALMLLGVAMQRQLPEKLMVEGFQKMILRMFLPALLLRAVSSLPRGQLGGSMLYPVLALGYSLYLTCGFAVLNGVVRVTRDTRERNSMMLMFPSLATGLTALPFIEAVVEGMPPGDVASGHLGVADLGIKFFVLFVLYVFARVISSWRTLPAQPAGAQGTGRRAIWFLIVGFFTEPVNLACMLGLAARALPPTNIPVLHDTVLALARCCTPAIFLYIGCNLQIPRRRHLKLLVLLVFRSGLGFLFVVALRRALALEKNETMFWLFFCSSSVSFWPYTHIVAVTAVEEQERADFLAGDCEKGDTVKGGPSQEIHWESFDVPLALMMLSTSFSWTVLCCTVIAATPVELWTHPIVLPVAGATFVVCSLTYLIVTSTCPCSGKELAAKEPVIDELSAEESTADASSSSSDMTNNQAHAVSPLNVTLQVPSWEARAFFQDIGSVGDGKIFCDESAEFFWNLPLDLEDHDVRMTIVAEVCERRRDVAGLRPKEESGDTTPEAVSLSPLSLGD